MRKDERNRKGITYSPSDITTFLESKVASSMDRHALEHPGEYTPDESDESATLIQKKGNKHEQAVLKQLQAESIEIVTIPSVGDFENRQRTTIDAMNAEAEVIYQAALAKAPFAGYADSLFQVEGNSKLGDYLYEAWTSKPARSLKPYFIA